MRYSPAAVARTLRERYGDWRSGARTYAYWTPQELGLGPEGHEYTPTPYPLLRHVLAQIPPASRHCGFMDMGCGLGRVLLAAHRAGFAPVIGVEFSPFLCERARELCAGRPITILQGDAAQVSILPEIGVFFLFNPFQGNTLQSVVTRIGVHARRQPCRVVVVNQGFFADFARLQSGLNLLCSGRAGRLDWAIYQQLAG